MVLLRSRKRFSVRPLKSAAGSVSWSWITALPCSSRRLSIRMAGSPRLPPPASARSPPPPPPPQASRPPPPLDAHALKGQRSAPGRLAQAVAALDVKELEHEAIRVVHGNEGAAPLPPHEDMLGHQVVGGMAQRADGHAERGRQRGLARQRSAGLALPRLDRAQQRALDLPV